MKFPGSCGTRFSLDFPRFSSLSVIPRPQQCPWGSTQRSGAPEGSKPCSQRLCQPGWILWLSCFPGNFFSGDPNTLKVLLMECCHTKQLNFLLGSPQKFGIFGRSVPSSPAGVSVPGELLFVPVLLGRPRALCCHLCSLAGAFLCNLWALSKPCNNRAPSW